VSTYIGGTRQCIEELASHDDLEAAILDPVGGGLGQRRAEPGTAQLVCHLPFVLLFTNSDSYLGRVRSAAWPGS